MKVMCISTTGHISFLPDHEKDYASDVGLAKQYLVYGMALWRCQMWYLIVGDSNPYPLWLPLELFAVVDGRLSRHWQYAINLERSDHVVDCIWGYEELVDGFKHFDNLSDQDSIAFALFLKYKYLLDIEFPDLGNLLTAQFVGEANWVQCPVCSEASQANPKDAMSRCSSCQVIAHNPLYTP